MITKSSKFCFVGLFVAVCFTISIFMCGDTECLTGSGDENCASLLCSLLTKHDAASQKADGGTGTDCSCVCHVPTVVDPVFNFSYHPAEQYRTVAGTLRISSAYNRLVYHPPALI